jgi:hypothetical protein
MRLSSAPRRRWVDAHLTAQGVKDGQSLADMCCGLAAFEIDNESNADIGGARQFMLAKAEGSAGIADRAAQLARCHGILSRSGIFHKSGGLSREKFPNGTIYRFSTVFQKEFPDREILCRLPDPRRNGKVFKVSPFRHMAAFWNSK